MAADDPGPPRLDPDHPDRDLDPDRLDPDRLDADRLDALWTFDDPAGSEARFRAALSAEPPGATAAELTSQLARAIGLQGRFDEASELLAAVDVRESTTVAIRVALERGRVLNSSGRAADAVPYFMDALTAAEGAGEEFLAVDAAHMLAIADGDRAMSWNRQALRMIEAASDPRVRRWTGSLHNNIGWTLHDEGDHAGALRHFRAALDAHSVSGRPEQVQVAHWAVARALRSLGRDDEALVIQLRLHDEGPGDGYVEEELGELYLAAGETDLARAHFVAAAALLGADAWIADHEPEHLARLRELGGLGSG